MQYNKLARTLIVGGTPDIELILRDGTQLSVVTASKGEQFSASIMGLLLAEFQKGFNLIRPLTDDQIADLALGFISDYWAYKLEDFVAFLQLAKTEVYGRILDRLDPNTILKMIAVYDEQRVTKLAARQTTKQESKQNLNPYARADYDEQTGGFVDRGAPIRDYIKKVTNLNNTMK